MKRRQPRNPFVPKVPGIQYPLLQQALLHPAYRGVFRLNPTLKMVTSFLLNSQSSLPTGTKPTILPRDHRFPTHACSNQAAAGAWGGGALAFTSCLAVFTRPHSCTITGKVGPLYIYQTSFAPTAACLLPLGVTIAAARPNCGLLQPTQLRGLAGNANLRTIPENRPETRYRVHTRPKAVTKPRTHQTTVKG